MNGMNIFGMRLGNSFYKTTRDDKICILLSKYKEYLEKLETHKEYVNILLCYDSLIKELYDYVDNLKNFDVVITGNSYKEKEQLVQKGTTLFFLADSMNDSNNIFSRFKQTPDNFDVLNCEYYNFKSQILKRTIE